MPNRIRKGDQVQIIAGKDKGRKGEVLRITHNGERVVVRDLNTVKRHVKPTQQRPQGGIVTQEAPLHVSNVMPIDPTDGKPCRVGFEEKDGVLRRVSRRTGAALDPA